MLEYNDLILREYKKERRGRVAFVISMIFVFAFVLFLSILLFLSSDNKVICIIFILPLAMVMVSIFEELPHIRRLNREIGYLEQKIIAEQAVQEIIEENNINYNSENGGK